MKALVSRFAARLGYDVVPRWRVAGLPLARRLQQIFAARQIDRVIDVGANQGQFRLFLRIEVGFTGEIISFEPIPEHAAKLQSLSAQDPRWTVHACALGAAAGTHTLNVAVATVFSSFLRPLASEPNEGSNVVQRTVEVPVQTLDSFFADAPSLERTYLKLDTQGFDLEVARGGVQVMRRIPALQSEISFRPIYQGMPPYQESIATFEQYGFRVSDLFRVTAAADDVAYEFDCLMVRAAETNEA